MLDIQRSMKAGGLSVHQVDLKSHGLDRYVAFDFLTWLGFWMILEPTKDARCRHARRPSLGQGFAKLKRGALAVSHCSSIIRIHTISP